MTVSIHEHEAVVAERDALRREVERLQNGWRQAFDTGIEHQEDAKQLRQQLAASQAREKKLREALSSVGELMLCGKKDHLLGRCNKASEIVISALSKHADTAALQTMIAKAGEVMRERCAKACDKRRRTVSNGNGLSMWSHDQASIAAGYCSDSVRALPDITLDDLKGVA